MQIRLLFLIAAFLLGYYIGRHMERASPVRDHLKRFEKGPTDSEHATEEAFRPADGPQP
ncbi:hypothetical protein [Thiohalorhabdus methylotrophus]|uniref:Uncharacterized protein n=1 Tax=Thiohalorhabdus methylotrophus TaxID=3242694 RepID=A0ABV4TSW5_9GAMM